MSEAVLKEVSPAVAKVATGYWVKSLEGHDDGAQKSAENPLHPYSVATVEQYQPSRDMLEKFETKRNILDKSMPAGKKLETINCFFNPSSESSLKKLLQSGWSSTYDAMDISFFSNANKAIQDSTVPYHKLLVCRVTLGREGVDYTLANGRYRLRDLNGVMVSFLITYRNANLPEQQTPPSSPFKVVSSASPTSAKVSVQSSPPPVRSQYASGQLVGDGKTCPSCTKENAGNTRYCVRCGSHL